MNTENIIKEFKSKDSHKIWRASGDVIKSSHDKKLIKPLTEHLDSIRKNTKDVEHGGALASNSRFLEKAIEIIEFYERDNGCPCKLYLKGKYDGFDPNKESVKGNIRIESKKEGEWMADYIASCSQCKREFEIEERNGHYTWFKWKLKTNREKNEIPKRVVKHINYLEERMKGKYKIESIEYLKKLPNEISYLTWSIGESEIDSSFKILAKNRKNREVELYAQTKSFFGMDI